MINPALRRIRPGAAQSSSWLRGLLVMILWMALAARVQVVLNQNPPPPYPVYNDGANNPIFGEGAGRLHVTGAVVLGMDGRVEFMKFATFTSQTKVAKNKGGLIWISPKFAKGAANWINPQPN